MEIFEYQLTGEAHVLMPPEQRGAGKVFDQLRGDPVDPLSWKPPPVEAATDGSGGTEATDFVIVWVEPAISDRAARILEGLLTPCAQLLPVQTDIGAYFVLNVFALPDALDESSSKIVRFPAGRVMRVDRHVFRPDVIGMRPLFKVPQLPRAPVFVTSTLMNAVAQYGLSGLDPRRVWTRGSSPATT